MIEIDPNQPFDRWQLFIVPETVMFTDGILIENVR